MPRAGHEGGDRAPDAPQPVPPNLGEVLARYDKVLIPEMNLASSPASCEPSSSWTPAPSRSASVPFRASEIEAEIQEMSR